MRNNVLTLVSGTFADYEWMMEEGADEKLQREVEEQLKLAELERLMMQEEKESGDLQVKIPPKWREGNLRSRVYDPGQVGAVFEISVKKILRVGPRRSQNSLGPTWAENSFGRPTSLTGPEI